MRSALLCYVVVLLVLMIFQRRLQYFPAAEPVPLPTGDDYRGLREVDLRAADGVRLCAWYWPGTSPVTLLLLHGNAGNRGHRLDWIEVLHDLGPGVFALDYRGYGGSEGSPTEAGLALDADAAVRWLEEQGSGPLIYVGESLGSGVAVALAERRAPRALILHAGFSSLADVARNAYRFLPMPIDLLMRDRYDCVDRLARIRRPLLMVHGSADDLVPPSIGRRLYDAANEPKEWCVVEGAGHNDLPWVRPREYRQRIEAFLRRVTESGVEDAGGDSPAGPAPKPDQGFTEETR